MAQKQRAGATSTADFDGLLEKVPEEILNHIYTKFGTDTLTSLASVACVSRKLNSSVHGPLYFPSIDLSANSFHPQAFPTNVWKIKKITFDCLHLDDSIIKPFLGSHVEELTLLKCCKLSYGFVTYIGKNCPNLRALELEYSGFIGESSRFNSNLRCLLKNCPLIEVNVINVRLLCHLWSLKNRVIVFFLQSLRIKVYGADAYAFGYISLGIYELLPKNLKVFKLDPAGLAQTVVFLTYSYPIPFGQTLTHMSLCVINITNALLNSISLTLPFLVELDLKDRPPLEEVVAEDDLSDSGIQSLVACKHLTNLSLRRSQRDGRRIVKFVTDTGMNFLAEGCKQLESVRFCGFFNVTDSGFAKIISLCLNLKIIEILHADLTYRSFKDLDKAGRPFVEVKLTKCQFINRNAVSELATCSALEVLDLRGCGRVTDFCIRKISSFTKLTSLNLENTNVSDNGMALLGKGNTPVSRLSLRNCKKITDKGIALLLGSEGKVVKTLSYLDLGHLPEITDNAITIIVDACVEITELCIRYCKHVTDASIKTLGSKGTLECESKLLRRLDLYSCSGLSVGIFESLENPLFRGLHWIGIGRTTLFVGIREGRLDKISKERRGLTICQFGCEMGCHGGWKFHSVGSPIFKNARAQNFLFG